MPHPARVVNLNRIAELLSQYDIVALQEVDGGSIRTSNINQVEYLAGAAGFPFWYQQLNRNLGKVAQHSNGVLSSIRPFSIEDHKLPGKVPGRGAIALKYGDRADPLIILVLHLSLGKRARRSQLAYVKELIKDYSKIIIMGDLNSSAEHLLAETPLKDIELHEPEGRQYTYPSWKPARNYDHILVSTNIKIKEAQVLPFGVSDHLPISMKIELPSLPSRIH